MTKTTEELKREMYASLTGFTKAFTIGNFAPPQFAELENALEAYLEALRQEADTLIVRLKGENERNVILLNAFRNQQNLTSDARTEADRERNRCQAFEFANKSAGEFLIEARAKIARQRQSIGQLKNDRNNAQSLAAVNYEKYQKARKELSELRKHLGATRIQNESENVAGDELKRFEEPSAAQACSRCKGSGMESNASGQWTAPCFKCATGFGVLKS